MKSWKSYRSDELITQAIKQNNFTHIGYALSTRLYIVLNENKTPSDPLPKDTRKHWTIYHLTHLMKQSQNLPKLTQKNKLNHIISAYPIRYCLYRCHTTTIPTNH